MKKRIYVVLFIILLSLILISVRGGKASYCVFYAAVLIPLMSLVYLIRVYLKFKLYQSIDNKTVVKGDRVNYTFDISNEDIITYTSIKVEFETDKTVIDDFDTDKVYSLLPGQKVSHHTTLYCKYCGQYDIGIKYAGIRDYLNLFLFHYKVDTMIRVKVLPRIITLDRLSLAFDESDDKVNAVTHGGGQRLDNQMRNYMPGDSAKMIHYKASARQNKLFSRQHADEPKRRVRVVLDNYIKSDDELTGIIVRDKLTEAVLAIAQYYYRNNVGVDIFYDENGLVCTSVYDKNTFNKFYKICSDGFKVSKRPFEYMLDTLSPDSRSDYIVLTSNLTDGTFVKCCNLISTGSNVNILYVGDDDISGLSGINQYIRLVKAGLNDEIEGVLTI